MTAPSSSIGSGSTTMSSTTPPSSSAKTTSRLQDFRCMSTPNLGAVSSPTSERGGGSYHTDSSLNFNSSSSVNTGMNNNKKKSRGFSLIKKKMPLKKLITGNKYPGTKIVKDSIPQLDDEIQIMTQDTPFMDEYASDSSICFFDRKEVILGNLLGEGQFAQVYEVKGLKLRDEKSEDMSREEQEKRLDFVHNLTTQQKQQQQNGSTNSNNQSSSRSYAIKHLKKDLLVKSSSLNRRKRKQHQQQKEPKDDDDETTAVEYAAGDSALPMDQQFQLAAADLVVEALYLSRIQHPNILRIRGMAQGGTNAFQTGRYDSFFLILDKLVETLDERIRRWRHTGPGQPQETQLCEKTIYAYKMAQALEYLHRHRIIFRDLKPLNIGFKQTDDQLQIFDFGLCRELPAAQTPDDLNEVYFMTAAGTHRYMAVEVHQGEQYNVKADVFSFAMVYYELLAQQAPFLNFSEEDHQKLVVERQHRPKHFFGCVVPMSIQKLLEDSWAHAIQNRLFMKDVVTRLEDILINTFQQTLTGIK